MNAWDDLPNGKRIDAVLAHCKTHYQEWKVASGAAWDAARDAARDAAWDAARDTARDAVWDATRAAASDAVWDATRAAARDAARDAGQALVAWDEAGDMLDMSVEEVQALSIVGIHAAVLLLPAVIAMNERK